MLHLPDLPAPSKKNISIKLKPAAERAIKQGHPWVYEDAIIKQSHQGQSGDLAVIYDKKKNKFLAVGLYDPASMIRIKILQANQAATINQAWFEERFTHAQAIRQPLIDNGTTGYRLIYGESDQLPSLIIDRYADTLGMKLYTLAWLPHLHDIFSALRSTIDFTRLVLRLSRSIEVNSYGLTDGMVIFGEAVTEPIQFVENGLTLQADVVHGHKTGFFFDQRDNRQRVRDLAKDKQVLDVFSYVGAFTVYALAGGATSVTSLDISKPAMKALEANVELNGYSLDKVDGIVADAFDGMKWLAKQGKRYELVIVDPPSFATSQSDIDRALLSYSRLIKLALPLVADDGILMMASCSSRIKPDVFFKLVMTTANQAGYHLDILEKTSHAIDHPIGFPEAEYLKALFVQQELPQN